MELITATRSGSRPGGRRSRKALTRLNIVALIEMPSARVMTATAINPGFFASIRMATRKSFQKMPIATPLPQGWVQAASHSQAGAKSVAANVEAAADVGVGLSGVHFRTALSRNEQRNQRSFGGC